MTGIREQKPLFHAVKHGDVLRVRQLLQNGVNPNDPRERIDRRTPLTVAAERGNTVLLRLLLDHGAVPEGETLRAAAFENHIEAVRLLLKAGVPATVQVGGYGLLDRLRWMPNSGEKWDGVKQLLREAGAQELPDWYLRWRWNMRYGWRLRLRRLFWSLGWRRR